MLNMLSLLSILRLLLLGVTSAICSRFGHGCDPLKRPLARISVFGSSIQVDAWDVLASIVAAVAAILLEPSHAFFYTLGVVSWPALTYSYTDECATTRQREALREMAHRIYCRLPCVLIGSVVCAVLPSASLFAACMVWALYYLLGSVMAYEKHGKSDRATVLTTASILQLFLLGTLMPASWTWAFMCAFMIGYNLSPFVRYVHRQRRCERCYSRCLKCTEFDNHVANKGKEMGSSIHMDE